MGLSSVWGGHHGQAGEAAGTTDGLMELGQQQQPHLLLLCRRMWEIISSKWKKGGMVCVIPRRGWEQHTPAAGCWLPCSRAGEGTSVLVQGAPSLPTPSGRYWSISHCIYPHSGYFEVTTAHHTTCKCLEIQLCVLGLLPLGASHGSAGQGEKDALRKLVCCVMLGIAKRVRKLFCLWLTGFGYIKFFPLDIKCAKFYAQVHGT